MLECIKLKTWNFFGNDGDLLINNLAGCQAKQPMTPEAGTRY